MVQRKTTNDNSGCCDPISDLQLEIDQVSAVATEAKTTANTASGRVDGIANAVNNLAESIGSFADDISLNTTNINSLIERLNEDEPKILSNSQKLITIEGNISSLDTQIDNIENDMLDLDKTIKTAVKEVTVSQDMSTVYHTAIKISGSTEVDALPVASRTQAGVMSASIYGSFEDAINNNSDRIAVLEQIGVTYDITGLVSSDPTDMEITSAFHSKYPTISIIAGIRVADYDNAHFWQYGNNTWIILTQIVVNKASNTSLGTVKGEESALGKVFVESDGSMSLNGYDALVSKDTTHDNKFIALETWKTDTDEQISSLNTDLNTLDGEIETLTGSINGLATDINTISGKVTSNTTAINENKTTITGINTQIATLKADKQDKLIAGDGISIGSDGKTISITSGDYTITDLDLSSIITLGTHGITVNYDVEIEYIYQYDTEINITRGYIKKGTLNVYNTGTIARFYLAGAPNVALSNISLSSSSPIYYSSHIYINISGSTKTIKPIVAYARNTYSSPTRYNISPHCTTMYNNVHLHTYTTIFDFILQYSTSYSNGNVLHHTTINEQLPQCRQMSYNGIK